MCEPVSSQAVFSTGVVIIVVKMKKKKKRLRPFQSHCKVFVTRATSVHFCMCVRTLLLAELMCAKWGRNTTVLIGIWDNHCRLRRGTVCSVAAAAAAAAFLHARTDTHWPFPGWSDGTICMKTPHPPRPHPTPSGSCLQNEEVPRNDLRTTSFPTAWAWHSHHLCGSSLVRKAVGQSRRRAVYSPGRQLLQFFARGSTLSMTANHFALCCAWPIHFQLIAFHRNALARDLASRKPYVEGAEGAPRWQRGPSMALSLFTGERAGAAWALSFVWTLMMSGAASEV